MKDYASPIHTTIDNKPFSMVPEQDSYEYDLDKMELTEDLRKDSMPINVHIEKDTKKWKDKCLKCGKKPKVVDESIYFKKHVKQKDKEKKKSKQSQPYRVMVPESIQQESKPIKVVQTHDSIPEVEDDYQLFVEDEDKQDTARFK